MGLFDFIKDAGEKLFKSGARESNAQEVAARLAQVVGDMGLEIDDLDVAFHEGLATMRGVAATQADREKAVLKVGNVQGVSQVDDRMTVKAPEPEATFYTVRAGDSLSKIAKAHYGDAMKYPVIFEANRPMLDNPDRIYPGQVLRIPTQ